ncbi:hypothetical protein [Pseudomonas sp.]|uniref:hypothetical protein n=1 Tax=Pseudomonas sp. TaxID=306 RepID=UPI002489B927|nr:hypothetical protein [Pseudomonas sp.]MDI1330141.1 hypothetical protein [Pseudomonas sp.]
MKPLEIFKEFNGYRFSAGRYKNLPNDSGSSTVTDRYYDVLVAELPEKRVEMILGEFQILFTAEQAHDLACHLILAGFDPDKFLDARNSPDSKAKWQQSYEA